MRYVALFLFVWGAIVAVIAVLEWLVLVPPEPLLKDHGFWCGVLVTVFALFLELYLCGLIDRKYSLWREDE